MACWFYILAIGVLHLLSKSVDAHQGWDKAHATFYGDMTGAETMQGACGYGDLFKQGYGLETAALSTVLFNNGLTCGACYQIRCIDNLRYCTSAAVTVTATNFCPPNFAELGDDGGWCNPPREHFDLSMPMFLRLVNDYRVGITPVAYRRVPCVRRGGMRFEIQGNLYWILVLVYNVGGFGDVAGVEVRGPRSGWSRMSRNWGQKWQTSMRLVGERLSFRVTGSDGRSVESVDVVPGNWRFGQSFEGKQF